MELCGPCVCCLHDGCFKAIWNSYTWMGEEEIYGSMLEQCFAVDVSTYSKNIKNKQTGLRILSPNQDDYPDNITYYK